MIVLLLFVVLFLALLLGFPVAFTLAGVSLIFAYFTGNTDILRLFPLRVYGTMNNFILIAVPLFIYMGSVLEKSGIAQRLLNTVAILLGRIKGGLGITVVLVGALLAASTGIVGATVVTMGLLSLPTMLKRHYQPELATGIIAASGTLGQIIPPSIVLVLLGSVMNVPVGNLFVGALIPGLLLITMYIIYVLGKANIQSYAAPSIPKEEFIILREGNFYKTIFIALFLPLVLIISVLGSIFAGIASPTEAAAIGALMATLLTVLEKKLSLKVLKHVMKETVHLTCMVFMILLGAIIFSLVFREFGGDDLIMNFIQRFDLNPYLFLVLVMVLIFLLGFFIDFIEIIFIFVPIITPIFEHFDINLLWVAILISVNIQTSFLTPPFGFSLFYLKAVAPPEIKTRHLYKGIIPFIIIQIVLIGIIVLFPDLVTWLPNYLD